MAAPWLLRDSDQSFLQRHAHWHEVLDPSQLLASDAEIKKAKSLVQSLESRNKGKDQENEVTEAMKLCTASIHPDSGHVLPLIFRPPVYVLLGAPLVVASLVRHTSVTAAFFFQLPFQTYNAGFTIMNGNRSLPEKSQQPLYLSASILYLTCIGAAPALAMKRLGIRSPAIHSFFGKILPPPLYGHEGDSTVPVGSSWHHCIDSLPDEMLFQYDEKPADVHSAWTPGCSCYLWDDGSCVIQHLSSEGMDQTR
ncbi:sideroflexin-4 isoform X5 [Ranitomeya imitator]|uniref:sideroflexin-4 isoform X5 n=1 Tax=Ranitomeya imitator TaxID=111125 RepID=UPI0037E8AC31